MAGRFVELRAGQYVARVDTVGAGLAGLEFLGKPLVLGYGDEGCPLASGVVMVPWPNRVFGGRFRFEGAEVALPVNEPAAGNALHGLGWEVEWELLEMQEAACALVLDPLPHWPWNARAVVRYELSDAGLRWGVEVTHVAGERAGCEGFLGERGGGGMPVGVGFHPYLSACGAPLDECVVEIAVGDPVPTGLASGVAASGEVASGEVGVRPVWDGRGVFGGQQWDDCFHRGVSAGGELVLARVVDEVGRGVELLASESCSFVQVFTADPVLGHGDGLGFPGVGRALAVEPQSAPPDMLNSGVGRVVLAPGEEFHAWAHIRAVGQLR